MYDYIINLLMKKQTFTLEMSIDCKNIRKICLVMEEFSKKC